MGSKSPNIFDYITKKNAPTTSVGDYNSLLSNNGLGSNYYNVSDTNVFSEIRLTPQQAYVWYERNYAVKNAVDRIINTALTINLKLINLNDPNKVNSNHPLLDMLYKNNKYTNSITLLTELYKSLLITGVFVPVFLNSIGDVFNSTPNTLDFVRGFEVVANQGSMSGGMLDAFRRGYGYIDNISLSAPYNTSVYSMQLKGANTIFVNEDNTKQCGYFTSEYNRNYPVPQIPLQSVVWQLYLIEYGLQHNVGMLSNGAKIPYIITPNEPLNSENYNKLLTDYYANFTGVAQAGKPLITNAPLNIKLLESKNNTDMEFSTLLDNAEKAIYNLFNIPVATYSTKTQTKSNAENADTALCEQAVIPIVNKFCQFITAFAKTRFDDLDDWKLGYIMEEIPAMQASGLKKAQLLSQLGSGIVKINEVRKPAGLVSLPEAQNVFITTPVKPAMTPPADNDDSDNEAQTPNT